MTKYRFGRFRILVGIFALFAVLVGAGLCYTLKSDGFKDRKLRPTGLSIGTPAPDFALKDLHGKTDRLSDQKGHVVLIDFWATWCPPCKRELPHIQRAYDRYKEKGLVVLTINLDLRRDTVAYYMSENGYTFPVLLSDGEVQLAYNVRGIPTLYIIDEEGIVRFYQRGIKPGLKKKMSGTISRLL